MIIINILKDSLFREWINQPTKARSDTYNRAVNSVKGPPISRCFLSKMIWLVLLILNSYFLYKDNEMHESKIAMCVHVIIYFLSKVRPPAQ